MPYKVQLSPQKQDLPRDAHITEGDTDQCLQGPLWGLGRTHTHQFFIHFCFDVSGESEKGLWNKHTVSTPEWETDGGLLVPGHLCTVGVLSSGASGSNSVRTERRPGAHLSSFISCPYPRVPMAHTWTTTSPEPMTLGGRITLDWSKVKRRLRRAE